MSSYQWRFYLQGNRVDSEVWSLLNWSDGTHIVFFANVFFKFLKQFNAISIPPTCFIYVVYDEPKNRVDCWLPLSLCRHRNIMSRYQVVMWYMWNYFIVISVVKFCMKYCSNLRIFKIIRHWYSMKCLTFLNDISKFKKKNVYYLYITFIWDDDI